MRIHETTRKVLLSLLYAMAIASMALEFVTTKIPGTNQYWRLTGIELVFGGATKTDSGQAYFSALNLLAISLVLVCAAGLLASLWRRRFSTLLIIFPVLALAFLILLRQSAVSVYLMPDLWRIVDCGPGYWLCLVSVIMAGVMGVWPQRRERSMPRSPEIHINIITQNNKTQNGDRK